MESYFGGLVMLLMLLGMILILLGILGVTVILVCTIIEEKKRKREIARKKMARLKKQKIQERKEKEMAIEKSFEDDVKIYMPKRSGFNLDNLTHAN